MTDTIVNQLNLSIEFEKLKAEVLRLKTRCNIEHGFLNDYLYTIEGIFESDPAQLSYEHYQDYLKCAEYMKRLYGRGNGNYIRRIEEYCNELPY